MAVLRDGGDRFLMMIRLAALDVVMRDKAAEAEAEKRAARSGGKP